MTSSTYDADLKGNNFRRSIHPQSFITVAVIFSKLDRGGFGVPPPGPEDRKKPGLGRVKEPMSIYSSVFTMQFYHTELAENVSGCE